jgi:hypothetical protein
MKLALKFTVSFGVLGFLFWWLPWGQMREALARMEVWVWLGVLGGLASAHLLGTVKWRMTLGAGKARMSFPQALQCYSAGLFANLCLPSIVGGDTLRAVLATRMTRRGEAVVLAGLADRLFDITSLALLALVGGLFTRNIVEGWVEQVLTLTLVLGAVGGLLVVLLVAKLPLQRWPPKVQRIARRSLVALRRLVRQPRIAVTALFLSLSVQTSLVFLMVIIGSSIGIEVPLAVWFLAWPLAKIAGLLPVSLAGLGVRDAAMAGLLVPAGVAYTSGFVASLIWETQLVGLGLLGGLVWLLLRRRNQPSAPRQEPDSTNRAKNLEKQYV